MKNPSGRIGIIAGTGELPGHIAHSLSSAGNDIFIAGLDESDPYIFDHPDWESVRIDFHRMQEVLDILRQADVTEVVLAGKVEHRGIFQVERFDERMLRFLGGLSDKRGATILTAVVGILEDEGYKVPSLLDIAPDLVPAPGLTAGPSPRALLPDDLKFGWSLARKTADLDIGQTVVVKDRSVVAVEAMEGTDDAIRRASKLAGDGLTVVKLAGRHHDFRFDVPTIGKRTMEALAERKECALVIEAGRCFILHLEEVLSICQEKGITLMSCSEDVNGEIIWPLK